MTPTAPARPAIAAPERRGGIDVAGFYQTHFMGAVFPLSAGILLYGWRGALAVAAVVAAAALSVLVWRRVGPRGRTLHYSHALWLALLLALMLPAHLAATHPSEGEQPWPILLLAGLILVIVLWLFGGLGGGRVHPVLVAYLLLTVCCGQMLVPHRILNRNHLVSGDLFHSVAPEGRPVYNEPWFGRTHASADADYYDEPAAERLSRYTSGREAPPRRWLPLQGLLRDSMPPLEDFVLAGQPGAIGISSAIAVIIGGLFLLYRGVLDYRIPLLVCVSAFAALLVLPIPSVIADAPTWRWAALRQPDIGWPVAITFANYEIMASPLLFTAFFLATAPSVRPMTRRGRTVYAILLGAAAAALQLYLSVSYGPYLALLIVSLLTPALDRLFKVRPAV